MRIILGFILLVTICFVQQANSNEHVKRKPKPVGIGLSKDFVKSIFKMSRKEWRSMVLNSRRKGVAIDMSRVDDTNKPFNVVENVILRRDQADYSGEGGVISMIGPTYVGENEITDIQFNWIFTMPYDGLGTRDLNLICHSSMRRNQEELAPDFEGLFKCHPPTEDSDSYWFQIFLYETPK